MLFPAIAVGVLLASTGVLAQAPAFKGALLFQPALANGQCMQAGDNSNGSPITLGVCSNADNQKFTFSGGKITAFGGSKCLDVPSGNTTNGVKLQLWDCTTGNQNQNWYWTPDNRLSWTDHGKCLDLPSGSTATGTRLQLWDCQGKQQNQHWNVGYWAASLPTTSQDGQTGTNDCGTTSAQTSQCQTLWINSLEDFCLLGPPVRDTIGNIEREAVVYCTKATHGTRVIPPGTLTGVHFVQTPDYVQITGVGNFTSILIPAGDDGGEMDNRGADGRGNPIGGLVYGNTFGPQWQYHEWTNFMSDDEFCIRACIGPNAPQNCQHIYDVMGCWFNMPASYDAGEFESCRGDNALPVGVYGNSTWYQGISPTPSGHPAPSSSSCTSLSTVGTGA